MKCRGTKQEVNRKINGIYLVLILSNLVITIKDVLRNRPNLNKVNLNRKALVEKKRKKEKSFN